jgi:hypothetical protein
VQRCRLRVRPRGHAQIPWVEEPVIGPIMPR